MLPLPVLASVVDQASFVKKFDSSVFDNSNAGETDDVDVTTGAAATASDGGDDVVVVVVANSEVGIKMSLVVAGDGINAGVAVAVAISFAKCSFLEFVSKTTEPEQMNSIPNNARRLAANRSYRAVSSVIRSVSESIFAAAAAALAIASVLAAASSLAVDCRSADSAASCCVSLVLSCVFKSPTVVCNIAAKARGVKQKTNVQKQQKNNKPFSEIFDSSSCCSTSMTSACAAAVAA